MGEFAAGVLVIGLGTGEAVMVVSGLTSALISGDSMAGVSETTGTFALGVGVAVFFPQPVKTVSAAAVTATDRKGVV